MAKKQLTKLPSDDDLIRPAVEPESPDEVVGKTLYEKMFYVQAAIDVVSKHGYNKFSKYSYATEADILTSLSPLLKQQRLLHSVHVMESDVHLEEMGDAFYSCADVRICLRIINIDKKDESAEFFMSGYAHDKNGDKALYKAITGASKYAYLKVFGLSTTDDPENDSGVARKHLTFKEFADGQVYPSRKPENNYKEKEQQEKDAVMEQISMLMDKSGLSKLDVMHITGLETLVNATLDQSEEALRHIIEYLDKQKMAPEVDVQ